MNTDVMRRLIELKDQVDRREAELKPLKEEFDAIEKAALEELRNAEVDSVTIRGVTLYSYTQRWAQRMPDVTQEQALAALKAAGLAEFVAEGFSIATLSAWFRERIDQKEPIPDEIKAAFTVREVPKLGVRRRSEAT